jgi:uncharacterized BrkB/YihY/UPF0761 family membrane protein
MGTAACPARTGWLDRTDRFWCCPKRSSLIIFTLVYAFVPQGDRLWRAALIGAGAATGLFLLAQGVFAVLSDVIWDNLSLLYGPLATAAVLLSWSWYVALITLAGGALASHIKVMILEDDSAQQAGRRHAGH